MKWTIISIFYFAASLSMAQNEPGSQFKPKNEWAVSITGYPFYKWFDSKDVVYVSLNGEYIHQNLKSAKTAFGLIGGATVWLGDDKFKPWSVFGIEVSEIHGRKNVFFEYGIGFSTDFDETFVTHPKIGGRINFGNHFLMKAYYIFYIRSDSHSILGYADQFVSISLGYRFNIGKKK
ncbi:MAG TPA: hypothetical protein P5514_10130 [Bacteroidales bacterium]|nr:hypothetical protein [Bacteroidales bacterium]HRX97291.1 hypothetical protein [Bacteroidales bacterium]